MTFNDAKISQIQKPNHNLYKKILKKAIWTLHPNKKPALICKTTVKKHENDAKVWEEILARHTSHKGPVSIMCKEISKLNKKNHQANTKIGQNF